MKYINKKACRERALELAESRFHRRKFTEVSESFYFHLDATISIAIEDLINGMASAGKTIRGLGK